MPDAKVTHILETSTPGDPRTAEELLPLVYEELRRLAHGRMAREWGSQTLQTTALVHEAYLKMVGGADVRWEGHGQFLAAAAHAMRQILIDAARTRQAVKRGGQRPRLDLDVVDPAVYAESSPSELLALDVALDKLREIDLRKTKIVELRFFAGLTIEQTARVLGLSRTTIKDEWQFTRAWLRDEMDRDGD